MANNSFYNQVNTASHDFTHNKKVMLVAAAVADELDYIKASVSKMSQAEFKGRKYGRTYHLYLPDVGTVHEGLEASPDDIHEVEADIMLNNFNTSVTLDAWNDLGDIENFKEQIAKPKGQLLARKMAKSVIKDNVFKDMQAVVVDKPSFGALSKASAALNELAVSGEIVSFMHPTVMGDIADSGLSNFIPGTVAKDIYGKNYLGQYAGAEQINCALLPTVTVPSTAPTATIALEADSDGEGNVVGFKPVSEITGTNLVPGLVFSTGGNLKIVDQSGIETEQEVKVIVLSVDSTGKKGTISPLRITVEGKGYGNPNAYVKEGTNAITLTSVLTAGKSYWVGQVRTRDCFAFDSYKFENLPGSENEDAATIGGVTVKMSTYGDGTTLTKLIRLDVPHAAGIWDARSAVAIYVAM